MRLQQKVGTYGALHLIPYETYTPSCTDSLHWARVQLASAGLSIKNLGVLLPLLLSLFSPVAIIQICLFVCVLLLQDLLQSCARGGRRRVEDMCYERRRAEACVDESAHHALVPLVWESNPKLQGGWCNPTTSPSGDLIPTIRGSGAHPGGAWS